MRAYSLGGYRISRFLAIHDCLSQIFIRGLLSPPQVYHRGVPAGCGVWPLQPLGIVLKELSRKRVLISALLAHLLRDLYVSFAKHTYDVGLHVPRQAV